MTHIVTFGTFDLFHIGHLNILQRARAMGTRLSVGVSSDALNLSKKGRYPVIGEASRLAIVAALAGVDHVFLEESLERKRDYLAALAADVLVMGEDWQGRLDALADICRVVYLPRTPGISTTALTGMIRRGEVERRDLTGGG